MAQHNFNDSLEKFSYALGLSISSNLIQSGVKKIEPANFMLALEDIFTGKEPKLTVEEANQVLQDFMEGQQSSEGNGQPGRRVAVFG